MNPFKNWAKNISKWGFTYFYLSIETAMYIVAWILLIFMCLCVFFDIGICVSDNKIQAIGVLLGVMYFLHSRWITYLKLRIQIYDNINDRYDKLNNKLDKVIANYNDDYPKEIYKEGDYRIHEKSVLLDYINLCAEEYNLYIKRFVKNDVWLTWVDGMVEKFAQCNKLYAVALNQAQGTEANNDIEVIEKLTLIGTRLIKSQTYYKLYSLMYLIQPNIEKRMQKKIG